MSSAVNVKELKQIIKLSARCKKEGVNLPLFVWGAHGIGKTTIMRDTSDEIDYDIVVLNLANQSPEELLGLGERNHEKMITEYYKPEWMKVDGERPVIYFLDEINRAAKYVLQAVFNFIAEGRIHTHQINEHDIIIAAANPLELDYDVTDFDDKAFLSRFAHVYLNPTHTEYIQYFEDNDVHRCVIELLKEDGEIFDAVALGDTAMMKIDPDPRMVFKAGKLLNIITDKEFKSIGMEILSAMIGTDKGAILANKFVHQNTIPEPADLLSGKISPEILTHDRMDVINAFNTKLVKHLKEEKIFGSTEIPENVVKAMGAYLEYIPKDAALGLVKEMKIAKVKTIELIKVFKGVDQAMLFDIMEVPVSE